MTEQAFAASMQGLIDNAVVGGDWCAPLTKVEAAMGARAILLHGHERFGAGARHFMEASAGLPGESIAQYQEFEGEDIRIIRGLAAAGGAIVCDSHFHDLAEIDRSAIYAEIYRPYDVGRFIGIRLGEANAATDRNLFLTLLRPNDAEAPTALEIAQAHMLARVLQSSMRAAAALAELRSTHNAGAMALDHAPYGCIFLQPGARVREINAAAKRIVARHDGLNIRRGVLSAMDTAAQAAILQLSAPVARGARVQTITIPRGDRRPYIMMLLHMKRDISTWLSTPAAVTALALIIDPDVQQSPPAALWQAAFNFTPAEAAVAMLLLEGRSQREIADVRGVGYHTVHSQIKRIYEKLGACSQTQAAALLMRAAPLAESG